MKTEREANRYRSRQSSNTLIERRAILQGMTWHLHSQMWRLRTPALISTLLIIPFIALELVNRRNSNATFPVVLFGLIWLLQFSFILIVSSTMAKFPTVTREPSARFELFGKATLLILIAFLWVTIMLDQLPCFLGVPNCD